jgi:hypothetical protein
LLVDLDLGNAFCPLRYHLSYSLQVLSKLLVENFLHCYKMDHWFDLIISTGLSMMQPEQLSMVLLKSICKCMNPLYSYRIKLWIHSTNNCESINSSEPKQKQWIHTQVASGLRSKLIIFTNFSKVELPKCLDMKSKLAQSYLWNRLNLETKWKLM